MELGIVSVIATSSGATASHLREGAVNLRAGMLLETGTASGTLKVAAMDLAMKIPMKVSTATSNFMIGVTAAAGD